MPTTVPDLEDEFDDSRATMWSCPTCGQEWPLTAARRGPPAAATLPASYYVPCPFFHV